ncbi:GNAT family N-acetyltransferase [Streptomyces sp. CBMA123]|uniref:GNAT family N-acetyltransferase n=1 Tax=Streptomyces sp. CBMA123 TaxID=1896313 RepID=UPI0016620F87|nr:GNAT family N-acetyltransferase [Streptomyces sp. CBMA123]MBD0691781.1 GNAT family N-acetyltransferase [Streptomyces sp. CBMA123]
MDDRKVTLRQMTPAEYQSATEIREADTIRELARLMPEEQARERTRQGTARFLPDGPDTPGHHLVVAEDESGRTVGTAWIGPDPRSESGTSTSAWLFHLRVLPEYRRHGYGAAILTAAEQLVARLGGTDLALNVFGGNDAAIALYRRCGYGVSAMSMSKTVRG